MHESPTAWLVTGLCEIQSCLDELDSIYRSPENYPSITNPCLQPDEVDSFVRSCVEQFTVSCDNSIRKIILENSLPTILFKAYNDSCSQSEIPVDACMMEAEQMSTCLLDGFIDQHYNLNLTGGALENELHYKTAMYFHNETTMCNFAEETNLDRFLECSFEFLRNCSHALHVVLPLVEGDAMGMFSMTLWPKDAMHASHIMKGLCNEHCDDMVGEYALMLDDCVYNYTMSNMSGRIDTDNMDSSRCMMIQDSWTCLRQNTGDCPLLEQQVNEWLEAQEGFLEDLTKCDDYISGGNQPPSPSPQPPVGKGSMNFLHMWLFITITSVSTIHNHYGTK